MGVKNRKEREQEARRQLILDSARELFKNKGFEAATVDEIAIKSEIGKGTVYSYFKSKDDIYLTIINSELDDLIDKLDIVSVNGLSSQERLRGIFDTYVNFYKGYTGLIGKFISKDQLGHTAFRITDLIAGLKLRANERYTIISRVLSEGIRNGEFIDIDTDKTAKIFMSLIMGLVTATEADQITELESFHKPVFDIFFKGIAK